MENENLKKLIGELAVDSDSTKSGIISKLKGFDLGDVEFEIQAEKLDINMAMEQISDDVISNRDSELKGKAMKSMDNLERELENLDFVQEALKENYGNGYVLKTERQTAKEELESSLEKFRNVYFGDEIEALRTKNERSNEMERSNKLSLEEQAVLSSMTGLVSGMLIEKTIEHIRDNQQKLETGQKIYDIGTDQTVSVIGDKGKGRLTVMDDDGKKFETDREQTIIAPKEAVRETGQGMERY